METPKNVLAMALPTIKPVATLAATPAPTTQPLQRASAGDAAKTETVIDVAAASASKVLLMVVSAYLGWADHPRWPRPQMNLASEFE